MAGGRGHRPPRDRPPFRDLRRAPPRARTASSLNTRCGRAPAVAATRACRRAASVPGPPDHRAGPAAVRAHGISTRTKPASRKAFFVHPEPATIEGDLAATPGPIRLVRLRLSLALVAMAFLPDRAVRADPQHRARRPARDRAGPGGPRRATVSRDARRPTRRRRLARSRRPARRAPSLVSCPGRRAARRAPRLPSPSCPAVRATARSRPRCSMRAVARSSGPSAARSSSPSRRWTSTPGRCGTERGRGAVETGKVGRADDGTARLAMATPIMGGARSATPIGVVRVEMSLDRLVRSPEPGRPSGGAARLVDSTGADRAGGRPTPADGATITSAARSPARPDWSIRLLRPPGWRRRRCRSSGCSCCSSPSSAIMIIWMARQVLRPAEELEASRGRLQDLYELARVDSLRDVTTGLGNHRAFQEAFERQVDAARTRGRRSASSSSTSTTSGRSTRRRARRRRRSPGRVRPARPATLRPSDRAFRTGGDEFALLLPGATIESAAAVARRLLAASMEVRPGRGEPAPRSFSAGVSAFPAMANDRRQLLDQADTALTWAKRHGRTSVEIVRPRTPPPGRTRRATRRPSSRPPSAWPRSSPGACSARSTSRSSTCDRPGGRVRGTHPADAGLRLRQPGRAVHAAEAGRSDGRARLRLSRDRRRRRAPTMGDESMLTLNLSPRTLEADDFSAGSLRRPGPAGPASTRPGSSSS